MFADLNIQMHTELRSTEPGSAVRVHTQHVFSRYMRGERNAPFGAVNTGKDRFVIGVLDFDVHSNTRG
uniref:Uncharacterized protein n=1 Tax=Anopheles christyi TaxID=43041 RepID=A0A182KHX0_9DIPT